MKKVSIAIIFLSVTFFFAACNSDSSDSTTTTDTVKADKPADTTSQITVAPADQESTDFVLKAAAGGMMEVEAGKLAQQNAQNQRVKDFGSMMVTDHSNANNELQGIAASKNITIPSSLPPEQQKHIDMMSKMTGKAFDKHYMDMMVNDHNKTIDDFKKASTNLKDDAIKNFAGKTLPTLQMHLDSAKAIHKKM